RRVRGDRHGDAARVHPPGCSRHQRHADRGRHRHWSRAEGDELMGHPVFSLPTHSILTRAGREIMRMSVAVTAVCLGFVGIAVAGESDAAIVRHNLNIPRQTLDVALKDLAKQTGMQIVRFSDAVSGDAVVGPLNGSYSVDQALKTLLAPSGLTYRPLNERA